MNPPIGIQPLTLKVKKLSKDARLPKYQTDGSGAFDFYLPENAFIDTHKKSVKVPLGVAVEVPHGYGLFIIPRSSTGLKTTLRQSNSIGLIDSDYRGEIAVILDNLDEVEAYALNKGERIAQGYLVKLPHVNIVEVNELSETERGTGGFGSTGTK